MMPKVIIVGGPSGTGKTTTAMLLASHYNCPFIEGDDLHPSENVKKMTIGEPLTDDDRWGWLERISLTGVEKATHPSNKSKLCVASCSMLKRSYREYLTKKGAGTEFCFVFLHASFETINRRVAARRNHFLKLNMVKSQFDIMEIPSDGELQKNGGSTIVIDCETGTPQELLDMIIYQLDRLSIPNL